MAIAIMAPLMVEPRDAFGIVGGPDSPTAAPRRYRLTRENFSTARTIGILFNGVPRNDVIAYDADEGWIETQSNRGRQNGRVEPYWRKFEETIERPQVDPVGRINRAEAKRARKAAKIAGRVA
ncbi:hypothetical protein [Mesorhizobium sp. Cs1299R1N3]|uniref:hypothetical protein n=1 Tax=Mesorhizobium sp. Cs1299R1N3 TaxID=3015173 RepID=UPI00301C1C23